MAAPANLERKVYEALAASIATAQAKADDALLYVERCKKDALRLKNGVLSVVEELRALGEPALLPPAGRGALPLGLRWDFGDRESLEVHDFEVDEESDVIFDAHYNRVGWGGGTRVGRGVHGLMYWVAQLQAAGMLK